MTVDDKQNEVKITIRNPDSYIHISNYVDISNGIRANYGKLKDGKTAISCYRFNKAFGWSFEKSRNWLRENGITLRKKDGVYNVNIEENYNSIENAQLAGIEDVQVGDKTITGKPIKLYDITDSIYTNHNINDIYDTKIILFGDVIKNGFTVGNIKLGVIGRRNKFAEGLAIESLPEHMRARVRVYHLKDDKITHIPLMMWKANLDCKTVFNYEDFEACVSAKESEGVSHDKALEICKAIAAQGNIGTPCMKLSKDGPIELIATVYAVKSIELNHGESHQYLLGINGKQTVPLGLSSPTNIQARIGDSLKVSCKYVDVHRDADNNKLWFNGSDIQVIEMCDYIEDPNDTIETLLWSEGYKSQLEYPNIFDVRAKTGTINNEWENQVRMIRGKHVFNEALEERMFADANGMKPFDANKKLELKKTGRFISQIHKGNDKYPTHTDLRLETNNGVESWMIYNRGIPCACNGCLKGAKMCEAFPKVQSIGWIKPIVNDAYVSNGEGTYEIVQSDANTKIYALHMKSGPMDGIVNTKVTFKREDTIDGSVWHLVNSSGFIEHVIIENNLDMVEVIELADGKGMSINVIALAQGLWNGKWYPNDELPKAKLKDTNVPARLNHRKADEDVCGTVPKLWYEQEHEYKGEKFPAAMANMNITKDDTVAKLKAKKIKSVSIGADVELSEEDIDNKRVMVCRDIVITEISLMDGIDPACDKCDIQNKCDEPTAKIASPIDDKDNKAKEV